MKLEAIILSKLEGVSVASPPGFLASPHHDTFCPSLLRAEGRDAENGYCSRLQRGKALAQRATEKGAVVMANVAKRLASKKGKVNNAKMSKGGVFFYLRRCGGVHGATRPLSR